MPKILIVEDTKVFAHMLIKQIEGELGFETVWATSMAQAAEFLEQDPEGFAAAVLDLTLEDSFHGEIVDLVAPRVASVVLTGSFDEQLHLSLWQKGVADIVLKEGQHNIDYLCEQLKRLAGNTRTTVLVVDDSKTFRHHLAGLLRRHNYSVLEAEDGERALELVQRVPGIRLTITDYNMPRKDGFELATALRKQFTRDKMAIIGVSGEGSTTSAKFIKTGADDFLRKPFGSEEFYCRVNHTLEMLEQIEYIKQAAYKDFLTGLPNRQHFFDLGRTTFDTLLAAGGATLVMCDIDHFKKINDSYGHDAGDRVIQHVAQMLNQGCGDEEALVARFGGEEFCILAPGADKDKAVQCLNEVREAIAATPAVFGTTRIPCTVSMGVALITENPLEEGISKADKLLYEAKNGGRNKVVAA